MHRKKPWDLGVSILNLISKHMYNRETIGNLGFIKVKTIYFETLIEKMKDNLERENDWK
jgi:hypothetical protein